MENATLTPMEKGTQSTEMANNNKKLRMKLLVDEQSHRVLFGEASKDVVDFLFGLLTLPLGSATGVLNQRVGSLGNLYGSVDNLDDDYMINPGHDRDALLRPKISSPHVSLLLLEDGASASSSRRYYRCIHNYQSRCSGYFTDSSGTRCPSCNNGMTTEMTYVAREPVAKKGGEGYVRGVVTYMVMDDLSVTPMSSISAITLLNKFHVGDVSLLSEKTVELSMEEGLELLEAALQSKTVLTDVFLKKTQVA